MRPILRYHGGKWMLAPWIISLMPSHRIYVEPFGGAASVLLRKTPSEVEIYNDLNSELVNLFEVLRDPIASAELSNLISLTPWSYEEWQKSYERSSISPIESARRLIFCSHSSIGTDASCRSNSTGGFRNYSRVDKMGAIPCKSWLKMPESIRQLSERIMGRVIIEHRDATHVMLQHDSDVTLHYVDPPYVKSTRGDQKDDYAFEMTDEDHIKLASSLHSLKGMVLLSGYKSDLYNELYRDWDYIERKVFADKALPRIEVVWFNFACQFQRALDTAAAL